MLQHKDVAIITMEEPVPASFTKVRPVCLPTGNDQERKLMSSIVESREADSGF